MNRDLRLFVLVVGLPALLLAGAGMRLVQLELARAARVAEVQETEEKRHRQMEQRRAELAKAREAKRAANGEKPPPEGPAREPRRAARRPQADGPLWIVRAFSDLEAQREREMLIGGCVMGLLLLSLVAGAGLLARAAKQARLEALQKTDFLSNVSHEFKTPLTTICLCAELAADDGLSPERRKKALASIVAESGRLKALVLNALDFSRLEKNRRVFTCAPCDLAALATAAGEPLRERFPHGLTLPDASPVLCAPRAQPTPSPVLCAPRAQPASSPVLCAPRAQPLLAQADASAVQQIVVILLENAAKYAAAGGPVECRVAAAAGRRVALTVADRGPGLDRNGLRHAFDRFWRGDNATTSETGGSGLGLAIARELAKGMHGTLTVAPRAGGGLVFQLTLPA